MNTFRNDPVMLVVKWSDDTPDWAVNYPANRSLSTHAYRAVQEKIDEFLAKRDELGINGVIVGPEVMEAAVHFDSAMTTDLSTMWSKSPLMQERFLALSDLTAKLVTLTVANETHPNNLRLNYEVGEMRSSVKRDPTLKSRHHNYSLEHLQSDLSRIVQLTAQADERYGGVSQDQAMTALISAMSSMWLNRMAKNS